MNTAEIFKHAPKYITQRFNSINSYVWKSFFPDDSLKDRLKRFGTEKEKADELTRLKEIVGEASLVILIVLLRIFFKEGSNAAIQTVDTFRELGVDGFQIGSKYFSERNENVMEGEVLAELLTESITSAELLGIVAEARYPFQIINRYKEFI